ncbi:MAG: nucleotide sugar dehydrogenase, partial [Candidatus Cloacimonetes bacterium]|nr:nucleotide sugar dehydrogenase [Candidatus Cloacimonadota bacterium]
GHDEYKSHNPETVVGLSGKKPLIIDCSNFLSDEVIQQYKALGCKVKGVGKGHIVNL